MTSKMPTMGQGTQLLQSAGSLTQPACGSRLGDQWTQRVGHFDSIVPLLARLGADPDAALRDAGLAPDALDDPEKRISYAALGRLLGTAVDTTHCAHLGLL